jgi:AraC-like DNA-binding protein
MNRFHEGERAYIELGLPEASEPLSLEFEDSLPIELRPSGEMVWLSNGGATRHHPAKSLPFSLEIALDDALAVERIEIVGVLARFADPKIEPYGTIGASVQFHREDQLVFRHDLIQGWHYDCAEDLPVIDRTNGDGTSMLTCGAVRLDEREYALSRLTLDVPDVESPTKFVFRDLGTPASFVILGVNLALARPIGCPFHSRSGQIPLKELGAIVRVGDRLRFTKALAQLSQGIAMSADLDEARGQGLTFLAVVTAGILEIGGSRELHRVQLEAARALESLSTREEVADYISNRCEEITAALFATPDSPSGHLVSRALSIVDRNYAKNLTDSAVADQLGLSTSHFRFLFKQATGNPFHKYLISVRLEKARQMLVEQGLPVSHVAAAVGFTGLSHFSRAFAQRFKASPTTLRRHAKAR